MTPLDLRVMPPRATRAQLLGFCFLPRTIDKLRAELPGGQLGDYLNHETGLSAFLVKRLGVDMGALREAVASAVDEEAVTVWLKARVDLSLAPAINAKFESLVVERMSEGDQDLVRQRHPVLAEQPQLSKLLDILDADDRYIFARA